MDLVSFLFGLAIVPAVAALWYLAWRLRNFIVRVVERPEPAQAAVRAALAARVYASRRVIVARFPHIVIAVTTGHTHHLHQRARMALDKEFPPMRESFGWVKTH